MREEVFVTEQGVPAENEIDGDESRSWHWVIYANSGDGGGDGSGSRGDGCSAGAGKGVGLVPVGTVRLVPPPHDLHLQHSFTSACMSASVPVSSASSALSSTSFTVAGSDISSTSINSRGEQQDGEPYVKLTRLAVLQTHRRRGFAARLTQTCLDWAAAHASEIDRSAGSRGLDQIPVEADERLSFRQWQGLVRIHAQIGAVRWYEGQGFELDKDEKGKVRDGWDEEGIWHLGMWKRVDLRYPEKE